MLHNEYLLDYIGKTKNQKTLDDLRNYAQEFLKENYCKPMSLIDISPNQEFLQLGMSIPNDLILDNFGHYLTGLVGRRNDIDLMIDDGGVTRTRQFNSTDQTVMFNTPQRGDFPNPVINMNNGTSFKLGQGLTEPQRDDIDIETDLADSPEKDFQGTLDGVFSEPLGRATIGKTFPASGGNGTVSEIGLFIFTGRFDDSPPSSAFMVTHDLVSPVIPYTIGQSINVELVWQT